MSQETNSPERAVETQSPDQAVAAIYDFAAGLMMQGVEPAEIKRKLAEQGLNAETAEIVVTNLVEARDRAIREEGQKNMLYGGLWFMGGVAVTAFSYLAAGPGGGRYVLAWGAILFGAIQFIRGAVQSSGRQKNL